MEKSRVLCAFGAAAVSASCGDNLGRRGTVYEQQDCVSGGRVRHPG